MGVILSRKMNTYIYNAFMMHAVTYREDTNYLLKVRIAKNKSPFPVRLSVDIKDAFRSLCDRQKEA